MRVLIMSSIAMAVLAVGTDINAGDIKRLSGDACHSPGLSCIDYNSGVLGWACGTVGGVSCPLLRDVTTSDLITLDAVVYDHSSGDRVTCYFYVNNTTGYQLYQTSRSSGISQVGVATLSLTTSDNWDAYSVYAFECVFPAYTGGGYSRLYTYEWEEG